MAPSLAALPAPPPALADSRAEAATPAALWHALTARWTWIASSTLFAFLAAVVFVNAVPPRYSGEAKVLIDSRESGHAPPGQDRIQPQIEEQALAGQMQVVLSRDLARAAIRELGLAGNPEFDPLIEGIGPLHRVLIMFGLASSPHDRSSEERILERYYESLRVAATDRPRVLSIAFRSRDPGLAARAADTVAGLYLALQDAAKRDAVRSGGTGLAVPEARIVSHAVEPQVPLSPDRTLIVALATAAGLLLAGGAILARALNGARGPRTQRDWMPAALGASGVREPIMTLSNRLEPSLFGFHRGGNALRGVRPAEDPGLSAEPPSIIAGPLDRYDFACLVERLSRAQPRGRGRRVLLTGVETPAAAIDIANGLGRVLSRGGRAVLVALDGAPEEPAARPGVTDLIAGAASFADIIAREPGSRLHLVAVGTLDRLLLQPEGVGLAFAAFDQTYDWVLCLMHDSRDARLMSVLASAVDMVVIASSADPASGPLVDLYERAKSAGAPDVVVAREQALGGVAVEMA